MSNLVIDTTAVNVVSENDGMITPKAKPQPTVCPGAPKKKAQKNDDQNLIIKHSPSQNSIKTLK